MLTPSVVRATLTARSPVRNTSLPKKLSSRRLHICQCESQTNEDQPVEESVAYNFSKELVDKFVENGMIVGIDSGDFCTNAIQEIGVQLSEGKLKGVKVIAACDAAASEAAFVGVPQAMSADCDSIDLMFSEVDELDIEHPDLPFVFGRRREPAQPQMPRFRAAATKAKKFVAILSSKEQAVTRLGRELPVLVANDTWEDTAEELDDIFIGDAEIWCMRRSAVPGALVEPNGGSNPYVTSDGNTIIDIKFYGSFCLVDDQTVLYEKLVQEVMAVDGCKSVGLLSGVATHVAIFNAGGGDTSIQVYSKEELAAAVAASGSDEY